MIINHDESPTGAADPLAAGDDAAELDRVLRQGGVRSVFQPIVELHTGRAVAYEALARGPGRSPLAAPQQLFEAAHRCGRVGELDLACQKAALRAARRGGLTDPWTVFVNVEPEAAKDALRVPGDEPVPGRLPAQPAGLRVIAELTERSLTADPCQLLNLVARVRRRGWGIALDDVGADRNSLALLPFIQPDVIKLDLRLIQDRPSADIAEIFSAVNAEAERSGAAVLAEGIEDDEHLSVALSLGATLGQGWLFGRPGAVPEDISAPAAMVDIMPCGPPASAATPFTLASAVLPPRLGRKDLLIEISKHLERQAMHCGEATVVLATFQEAAFFTPDTRRRYRRLVEKAAFVGVLGEGMPPAPMPGVRGGLLPLTDPLLSEWTITVTGPHFAACLTARDLGDTGPDMQRRFEFVLSHDRELVIQAAAALFSRIAPGPDSLAGPL